MDTLDNCPYWPFAMEVADINFNRVMPPNIAKPFYIAREPLTAGWFKQHGLALIKRFTECYSTAPQDYFPKSIYDALNTESFGGYRRKSSDWSEHAYVEDRRDTAPMGELPKAQMQALLWWLNWNRSHPLSSPVLRYDARLFKLGFPTEEEWQVTQTDDDAGNAFGLANSTGCSLLWSSNDSDVVEVADSPGYRLVFAIEREFESCDVHIPELRDFYWLQRTTKEIVSELPKEQQVILERYETAKTWESRSEIMFTAQLDEFPGELALRYLEAAFWRLRTTWSRVLEQLPDNLLTGYFFNERILDAFFEAPTASSDHYRRDLDTRRRLARVIARVGGDELVDRVTGYYEFSRDGEVSRLLVEMLLGMRARVDRTRIEQKLEGTTGRRREALCTLVR